MSERVGVLFVHGIGEQGRFEHLEAEVRNLVSAWEERGARVRVQVNTSDDAAFAARQRTWQADDQPPIEVFVEDQGRRTRLDFHEVWWADLDEPTTLPAALRFWFWGLSLWNTRRYVDPHKPAYDAWMRPPAHWGDTHLGLTRSTRLRLFALGIILLMTFFTFSLVNFLSEWIFRRRPIPSDILVNYLGDVKLYQQAWRPGKGPLGTIGQPPRVALRKRMVRQMLRMSMADYDRWYILAHSQGTILAFNALMEPAERLPHYLTESQWQQMRPSLARRPPQAGSVPRDETPQDAATNDSALLQGLRPPRPEWLAADDAIDRARVFARLRGFLTYGSPLETFASLWPAIVSLNRDESVFAPDFEWINVVDPTDPVATEIRHFDPARGARPQPRNVLYRAQGWHLVSHIRYLSHQRQAPHLLVHAVCSWLQTRSAFVPSPPGTRHWPGARGVRWLHSGREATWLLWAAALALAVGNGLHVLLCTAASTPAGPPALQFVLDRLCAFSTTAAAQLPFGPSWVAHAVVTLVVCAVLVLISGVIARTPWCRHGRL